MMTLNRTFFKRAAALLTGGLAGLAVLAVTPANAFERPDPCYVDHDHRSHYANYYDYYAADRYSRAGPYRSGTSFSITFGSSDFDRRSDRRYRDRGYSDRSYRRTGYYDNSRRNRGGSKLIRRQSYNTKFRARINLREDLVYTRRGKRLICTVSVYGPERNYVPTRRLKRIAHRDCSRHARIRINN